MLDQSTLEQLRSNPVEWRRRGLTPPADLVVTGADLVATMDGERRELLGGWVAVTNGLVSAIGTSGDPSPAAVRELRADGCLVTPGLVNAHHHLFQNLTRAFPPMTSAPLDCACNRKDEKSVVDPNG